MMLDLLEESGVCSICSNANAPVALGWGNGKVKRDWRSETILEMRLVIELCRSCGLEILACTSESLSLRVPRKLLALSVSRIRNSSLRSGLKNTLLYRNDSLRRREPFYYTNDETGAPNHPQYSSREYNTEARCGESDGAFDS
jgi:hypothetical protein